MDTTLERPGAERRQATARPLRLSQFNRLPRDEALRLVQPCLAVPRWWTAVVDTRPYASVETLFETARDAAQPLTGAELDAAVGCHLDALAAVELLATRRITRPAAGELSSAAAVRRLDEDLRRYQQRFGRPFVIRTAGRSPAQIAAQLHARLGNDQAGEDRAVAVQLRQIAVLALIQRVSY